MKTKTSAEPEWKRLTAAAAVAEKSRSAPRRGGVDGCHFREEIWAMSVSGFYAMCLLYVQCGAYVSVDLDITLPLLCSAIAAAAHARSAFFICKC